MLSIVPAALLFLKPHGNNFTKRGQKALSPHHEPHSLSPWFTNCNKLKNSTNAIEEQSPHKRASGAVLDVFVLLIKDWSQMTSPYQPQLKLIGGGHRRTDGHYELISLEFPKQEQLRILGCQSTDTLNTIHVLTVTVKSTAVDGMLPVRYSQNTFTLLR